MARGNEPWATGMERHVRRVTQVRMLHMPHPSSLPCPITYPFKHKNLWVGVFYLFFTALSIFYFPYALSINYFPNLCTALSIVYFPYALSINYFPNFCTALSIVYFPYALSINYFPNLCTALSIFYFPYALSINYFPYCSFQVYFLHLVSVPNKYQLV